MTAILSYAISITDHLRAAARRNAYIGDACTIAGSIGFSGKTVIVKLAYRYGVDVMTLLALRMLFALPLLLAMTWWAGSPPATIARRDWLSMLALGFVGYYLGSYLDLAGLQYISASLGRLTLYLYPTIVLVISALFLVLVCGARSWGSGSLERKRLHRSLIESTPAQELERRSHE